MDIVKLNIPCAANINTLKAYVDFKDVKQTTNKSLNALDLDKFLIDPKPLRILILDKIVENWHDNPLLTELPREADRNYLLDHIDVNLPIKILSTYIKSDIFWKRCFRNRWKSFYPNIDNKSWISVYMEKHLAETLEKMETTDYDQESMQTILDVCAPYIVNLDVTYLQPSMEERTGHIPFDFILANLTELKIFRITFATKTIGTQYYLGCSSPTKSDILYLGRGIQKCYDLVEFHFHRTKLDPSMLKTIARCLDKGCTALETLSLTHCRFGDAGVVQFLYSLSTDSFVTLRAIILTNNLLSQESALLLSRVLKGRKNLHHLDLRLNPIGSDGAAAIFSILGSLPIVTLNVSACSITETINRLLMKLLIESKSLINIDISNNELGDEVGRNIYRVIGFNKRLKCLDLRNTGTSTEVKNKILSLLFDNRDKL